MCTAVREKGDSPSGKLSRANGGDSLDANLIVELIDKTLYSLSKIFCVELHEVDGIRLEEAGNPDQISWLSLWMHLTPGTEKVSVRVIHNRRYGNFHLPLT